MSNTAMLFLALGLSCPAFSQCIYLSGKAKVLYKNGTEESVNGLGCSTLAWTRDEEVVYITS